MNHQAYSEHLNWVAEGESHAVVIGGSLAGLLSARVLSDYFTVIERDVYPEMPEARRGVPQAHHLHALYRKRIVDTDGRRWRGRFPDVG